MHNQQLLQELAKKHKALIPPKSKQEEYFIGSFLGPLFACLLPIFGGAYQNGRSTLVIIFIVSGFLWYQIYYWGHHITEFKTFKQMSEEQQQECLFYDSFWRNLVRSGMGAYMGIGMFWGVLEMGFEQGFFTFTSILIVTFIIFVTVCLIKWQWIVQVANDGLKKHTYVRYLVVIVFGLIGGLPLLPGMASMVRVTQGQDGLNAMVPFIMTALLIIAMVTFVLTLLGFIRAFAQYTQWHHIKS